MTERKYRAITIGMEDPRGAERPLDAADLLRDIAEAIEDEYENKKTGAMQPFLVINVFVDFFAGIATVYVRDQDQPE